jgi:palmitoyl-protein thioesterase
MFFSQDLLGLQHLNSTGRIHFLSSPTDHLRFTTDWFKTYLLPFINVDSSEVHLPIKLPV